MGDEMGTTGRKGNKEFVSQKDFTSKGKRPVSFEERRRGYPILNHFKRGFRRQRKKKKGVSLR